jgi:hypothetical protein
MESWRAGGSRRRRACGSDEFREGWRAGVRAVRERRYSRRRAFRLEGVVGCGRGFAAGVAGGGCWRSCWLLEAGAVYNILLIVSRDESRAQPPSHPCHVSSRLHSRPCCSSAQAAAGYSLRL